MLQTFWLQLTIITLSLCLTHELPFPVCQKHVLTNYNPKPALVQTQTYKVNGASGNSHWSSLNHYMHSRIPYKISTAVHSL